MLFPYQIQPKTQCVTSPSITTEPSHMFVARAFRVFVQRNSCSYWLNRCATNWPRRTCGLVISGTSSPQTENPKREVFVLLGWRWPRVLQLSQESYSMSPCPDTHTHTYISIHVVEKLHLHRALTRLFNCLACMGACIYKLGYC